MSGKLARTVMVCAQFPDARTKMKRCKELKLKIGHHRMLKVNFPFPEAQIPFVDCARVTCNNKKKSNNDLKKILFKFRTNHVVMRSPYIYIMLDTIMWSVQCSWLKYHIRWNIDPWKLLPCFVHHTQKNRIIDKVTRIQLEIVRHLPVKTFGNWSKLWKWK